MKGVTGMIWYCNAMNGISGLSSAQG
jgi:hypothetical protein